MNAPAQRVGVHPGTKLIIRGSISLVFAAAYIAVLGSGMPYRGGFGTLAAVAVAVAVNGSLNSPDMLQTSRSIWGRNLAGGKDAPAAVAPASL